MKRSLNLADLKSALTKKEPAIIQAVEGGHFLEGKIERLKIAYDRGLRVLGLLHDNDASVPLGDIYTISGTASTSGTAVFPLTFGGQSCSLSLTVSPTGSSTTSSATVFPAFTVGNGNTAQIVAAANTFLATLDATQKTAVLLDFTSTKKSVWSNFPISDVTRNGILTGTMTAAQRTAAYNLVAMLCSQYGYEELGKTMVADQYLVDTTKPSWTGGTTNYAIAIFGTPSTTAPWMIQYGGHHMAINATIVGSNNVFTPSLTGAQPTSFTSNGTTVRVWANQTDKGFALVNALTAAQQTKAVLNYTVSDLVLGPGTDGKTIVPEGIKGSDLTAAQQTQLLDLISEWTNIANTAAATAKLAEIKVNIADTYFAWSGPLTAGSVVYFRIQGPTVIIEYSSQQKNAAHIHNMYRDPTNDYGKKLL